VVACKLLMKWTNSWGGNLRN